MPMRRSGVFVFLIVKQNSARHIRPVPKLLHDQIAAASQSNRNELGHVEANGKADAMRFALVVLELEADDCGIAQ